MGMERSIILGVKGESEEILLESGGGITIPPEDAVALARSVAKLADDRQLCTTLGLAGRRFVSGKFSRERLATQMLAELEQVAACEEAISYDHNG
jgi:glycosyltransferase involved in cell wall biosynthesis